MLHPSVGRWCHSSGAWASDPSLTTSLTSRHVFVSERGLGSSLALVASLPPTPCRPAELGAAGGGRRAPAAAHGRTPAGGRASADPSTPAASPAVRPAGTEARERDKQLERLPGPEPPGDSACSAPSREQVARLHVSTRGPASRYSEHGHLQVTTGPPAQRGMGTLSPKGSAQSHSPL